MHSSMGKHWGNAIVAAIVVAALAAGLVGVGIGLLLTKIF